MATDTRCRVKLYSFSENRQWEDMGTGHVTLSYLERLQGLTLVVRSETDGKLLNLIYPCSLSIPPLIRPLCYIYLSIFSYHLSIVCYIHPFVFSVIELSLFSIKRFDYP